MAVTAAPTNVTTVTIKAYQAANPSVQLTHCALVNTAPGSLATPSNLAGGFFDLWYDPLNNKLIIDTTSTTT